MKKGRIIANIVVLLIAGAAVFYIGWIQFKVKPGECGVLVSKTNGVYSKPILPGTFVWRWERLLPTNADIRIFSLTPKQSKQTVSGALPSAELYSKQLKEEPDFSYCANIVVTLGMKSEEIVSHVQKYNWKSQAELDSFLESKSSVLAKRIMEYCILKKKESMTFVPTAVTAEELNKMVSDDEADFSDVMIDSIQIAYIKIPDFALYETAKNAYETYQNEVAEVMKKEAAAQAASMITENRSLQRLEKLGELLKKYPQLQDIFKSGDASSIMNAIKLFE